MEFTFKTLETYLEAYEYLLRVNKGFTYNKEDRVIKIELIEVIHGEKYYDESVVNTLIKIAGNHANTAGKSSAEEMYNVL